MRTLKRHIQRVLPLRHPAILIASMGRSGSTLIFEAVAEHLARDLFSSPAFALKRVVRGFAWRLDEDPIIQGVVYKTHDLSRNLTPNVPLKAVFVFCAASDSVLSVRRCYEKFGAAWVDEHFEHLRADGDFEELLERDVLRIADQIDCWTQEDRFDVLALRYETLWQQEETLSDYLGFRVRLPPRRTRQSLDLDPGLVRTARKTYEHLDRRIASLPDAFRAPLPASETTISKVGSTA